MPQARCFTPPVLPVAEKDWIQISVAKRNRDTLLICSTVCPSEQAPVVPQRSRTNSLTIMKNRPHALQKFTKGQILISFYSSEGKILVPTAVSTACEPGAE